MTPYLSDAEVLEICDPLKLGKAQCRYLARLGMVVKNKPNGKPLIARGEFERVMIGKQLDAKNALTGTQPNTSALLNHVQKGKKNGAQA